MKDEAGYLIGAAIALVFGSVLIGLLIGITWRVAAWVAG